MNRYQKSIRNIRNRHNRIVAFSEKIQEAMGLTDEDLKVASRNGMYWELPDFVTIEFITSQGRNVLVIKTRSEARYAVKTPPSKAEQKEFIKLIKANK